MKHFLKNLLLTAFLLSLMTGSVWAYGESTKNVFITINGDKQKIETNKQTIKEILEQAGIVIEAGDYINKSLHRIINHDEEIIIKKAIPIILTLDGVPKYMQTTAETVSEILADMEIDYQLTTHKLEDRLHPNMEIRMHSKLYQDIVLQEKLTFQTIEKENPYLPVGTKKLVIEGEAGEKNIYKRNLFIGGELKKSDFLWEEIVKKPVNEVYEIGTKANTGIGNRPFKKMLRMEATAYTKFDPGCTNYTATGALVKPGIVAVDPRVIPLGTKLYVEGYGEALAADTGGAIKGHKIDLVYETVKDAKRFGRRHINVYVLEQ